MPTNCDTVLLGDFNINFNDKESPNTISLSILLQSFNLRMHVYSPTRVTRYSSTLIDYFCSSFGSQVDCSVIASGLSDHEAVLGRVCFQSSSKKQKHKFGRLFSGANYNKFVQICSKVNWNSIMQTVEPLLNFHLKLKECFNQAFPIQKIKLKSKKPWFTNGLRVSAANMRCLHTIRKFTNNYNFHIYFQNYRSVYRKLIKLAKDKYYSSRLTASNNLQRESWAIINELRGSDLSHSNIPNITPDNLNNYYCTIAENLTNKLIQVRDPLSYLKDITVQQSFFFSPTDYNEILQIISSIKNKASHGEDNVSAKIFLSLPEVALRALSEAINHLWVCGLYPSSLKNATVIPLHKGGTWEDPGNFRPISLLSTISKIVEKLVKVRMVSFLEQHKIIHFSQFGFQSQKGTSDAIFQFLERVYCGLNEREAVAAVFCDLSKAFDCVSHEILLGKLAMYGFRGEVLRFFESFLKDRMQRVVIGSESSDLARISWGVPQGSVLGPILFLLYINDLPLINIQGEFTLFADDATILWHNPDVGLLRDTILSDLPKINEWCSSNFPTLNIKKTNIVSFNCVLDRMDIGGLLLETRTETKFLGLRY